MHGLINHVGTPCGVMNLMPVLAWFAAITAIIKWDDELVINMCSFSRSWDDMLMSGSDFCMVPSISTGENSAVWWSATKWINSSDYELSVAIFNHSKWLASSNQRHESNLLVRAIDVKFNCFES